MSLALHALQIVSPKVATGITIRAIVVIPCLRSHLGRHQQTCYSSCNGSKLFPVFKKSLHQGCNCPCSQTYPYGKGIEGACIGIVALTRLERCLVEIEHDGQSSHEEQQHDNEQLLPALMSIPAYTPTRSAPLPQHTQQAKQQRHSIKDIMPFVLCQIGWQLRCVTA